MTKVKIGDKVLVYPPVAHQIRKNGRARRVWPVYGSEVVGIRGDKVLVTAYDLFSGPEEVEVPAYRVKPLIRGRHRARPFPRGSRNVWKQD